MGTVTWTRIPRNKSKMSWEWLHPMMNGHILKILSCTIITKFYNGFQYIKFACVAVI